VGAGSPLDAMTWRCDYLVVLEPDEVEPVDPLVPELLEVPVDPLVEGIVLLELPEEPMPDVLPELDEPVEPVEPLADGEVLVAPPPEAPMPDVEPELDEPLMPLLDEDGREVDEEVEGVVEPLAEPPAAPMPEAEPLPDPEAEGLELHAARAAEQAMARINLFIRELLFFDGPVAAERRGEESKTAVRRAWEAVPAGRDSRRSRPAGPVGRCAARRQRRPVRDVESARTRTLRATPSGPKRTTSSAWPLRTGRSR
jgi:hypothetical protein